MEVGVGSKALSRDTESIFQFAAILPRRASTRRILMKAARQLALDEALKN